MKFIDSNVLVYAFDSLAGKKYRKSKELLEKCLKGEVGMGSSVQNLSEFFVVSTNKIESPISKENAEKIVKNFVKHKNFKVFPIHPQSVVKASELEKKYNSSYWDSLIAAVMLENEVLEIYTENIKDFEKIEPINPKSPFD